MTALRRTLAGEHPAEVWVLAAGGAITAIGSSMVAPLFTLFFTSRFGIGLAAAGGLAALFFVGGMVGQTLGGHLADAIGRRPVMLAAVFGSAAASLAVGFAPSLALVVPAVIAFGVLAAAFQPAGGALVADLVTPEQRVRAFALLRVAFNAGFAIGPALAGLFLAMGRDASGTLADTAYRPLFVIDAATSVIFGLLVAWRIRESRPALVALPGVPAGPPAGGYRVVLANRLFLVFAALWALVTVVYIQLFSTVGPYLATDEAFPVEQFATLLSVNAGLVVVAQLWVTRAGQRLGLRRTLALGAACQGLGLMIVPLGGSVPAVVAAIVVFTIGEMLFAPTGDAVAAGFADEANRGRYLGLFALASGTGMALGPVLGGLMIDGGRGPMLWPLALAVSIVAGAALSRVVRARDRALAPPAGAHRSARADDPTLLVERAA